MYYSSLLIDIYKPKCRWIFTILAAFGGVCWLIILFQDSIYRKHVVRTGLPQTFSMFLSVNKSSNTPENPHSFSELIQIINERNTKEKILNAGKFNAIRKDTIVIVILQVGQNSDHLKYLIASLANSKGIQDTLIIFSHLHYDERINYLIGKINYCKVLQIFYPLSINMYPGLDNGSDSNTRAAKSKICSRFPTSDKAENCHWDAEKKLHWWWTANMVFDKLKYTSDHEGLVTFADDDFYFLEDSIYMMSFMRNICRSMNDCDFVSIGENAQSKFEVQHTSAVEVVTWNAKDFATVVGFDIATWNTIVSHYDVFCNVDDDSWSASVYHLTVNRKDNKKYRVITTVFPRAYKLSLIDDSHYNILLSNLANRLYNIIELQKLIKNQFYPNEVEIVTDILLEDDDLPMYEFPRGGWSDPRNRVLCFNTTFNKFRKVLLDMEVAFNDYV